MLTVPPVRIKGSGLVADFHKEDHHTAILFNLYSADTRVQKTKIENFIELDDCRRA